VRGLHSLYTTDLVLDSCDSLAAKAVALGWTKEQFLAAASRHMRDRLVDGRRKRKEELTDREIDLLLIAGPLDERGEARLGVEELQAALEELRAEDERSARVIELRYFANARLEDVAASLSLSVGTVKTDQRFAIAFLRDALGGEHRDD
jgi:RNA polymerase sigma factor (sigma-70 family)